MLNEQQLRNHLAMIFVAGLGKSFHRQLDVQAPILASHRALAEENQRLKDERDRWWDAATKRACELTLIEAERDQLKDIIARIAQILADHRGDANKMVTDDQTVSGTGHAITADSYQSAHR